MEIFSRDSLPTIKDGAHVINLDDKQSKIMHWVSLVIDRNTAVYWDFFGTEYIPQEVLRKIKGKSITQKIFRIQSDDSTMCSLSFIVFIESLIAGKTWLDYTNIYNFS